MPGRTPHDLALFVYGRLDDTDSRPSIEVLDELFQTLFLTSLKTEEGVPISCSVIYVDPKNPDPNPPQRIRDQRWRYTALADPPEYNVSQLAKIALATDPSSSSLAVYPDRKGGLKIWGLFDQQGGFQSLLSHESEGGFRPPGVLQAQILGLGHIIVTDAYAVIAELNGGNLVEDAVDVFDGSIVFKKLAAGFERRLSQITQTLETEGYSLDQEFASYAGRNWINTIRRILLRARGSGHGGAFLLTGSDYEGRLNIKYKLRYGRIPMLFNNWMSGTFSEMQSDEILNKGLDDDLSHIDPIVYLDNVVAGGAADDAKEGLAEAVGFVASLSRVDGLVLMDTDLVVHGFGCEITATGDSNCSFFQANHSKPSKGKIQKLDLERFGTRHRSMARYCSEDESAVGFILSNDGPIRAFSRSGKRVYFWDNVQLGLTRPFRGD